MTTERTLSRPTEPETQEVQLNNGPATPGSNSVLERAVQYANIARQSRAQCQQGADAEQELRRRRNPTGQ